MALRRWRLDSDRRHSDDDHIGTAAAAQDGRTAAAHRCSSQGRRQRCRDVDGALTQLSGLDSDWFYGAGVGTWMGGELKCDCCNGLWWSSREDDESGGPVMASAAPALREDLRGEEMTLRRTAAWRPTLRRTAARRAHPGDKRRHGGGCGVDAAVADFRAAATRQRPARGAPGGRRPLTSRPGARETVADKWGYYQFFSVTKLNRQKLN
jgi:hypothetical protein